MERMVIRCNLKCKKVGSKEINNLKKEEVKDFVKEILETEGFPVEGTVRYVFFRDGHLWVSFEVSKRSKVTWDEEEYNVFTIESLGSYKNRLPANATLKELVNCYLDIAFANWNINDYLN